MAMTEPTIVTAAEMEKLSPNERAAIVRKHMVTDLDAADPELVAWAREQAKALLEARR